MRDHSLSRTLQRNLILYVALGFLVIGLIVAMVSIVPLYQALTENVEQHLQFALSAKSHAVEEFLLRSQEIARQVTSRSRIREELAAYNRGAISRSELTDFSQPKLDDALKVSPELVGIIRLDQQNNSVVSVGQPIPPELWPIPPPGSTDVRFGQPLQRGQHSYLILGAPILGAGSGRVGTDIILFDLANLERIVADISGLGASTRFLLGQFDGDQPHLILPVETETGGEINLLANDSAAVQALRQAVNQETGLLAGEGSSVQPVVIGYQPIPGTAWGLVAEIDQALLFQSIRNQLMLVGGSLLLLILLGVAGMILLLRPLTNRVLIHTDELAGQIQEKTAALESELSERRRMEAALRESEARYSSLFHNNHSVMFIIDPETAEIVDANPGACAFYGYDLAELTSRKISDINILSPAQVKAEMAQAKQEQRRQFFFQHRLASGQIRDVEIYSGPIVVEGRQFLYSIVHDITDRKEMVRALQESEEKYRNIIESIPLGMHLYRLEPEGTLIFTGANPAADQILGIDHRALEGEPIELAFPGLVDSDLPDRYRRVAQTGHLWHADQTTYDEGQIQGSFEVHAFQTSPDRVAVAFVDITERKQNELMINQLRRQNELILNAAGEGILGLDETGRHSFVNPAAAKMLGYRPEELVGQPSHSLWHHTRMNGTSCPVRECPIFAASEKGEVYRAEEELFWRKDGTSFPVQYVSTPIVEHGKLVGTVVVFSDITDRKQIEKELHHLNQALEERVADRTAQLRAANKELEAFAYSVSHDLRAPLRSINGFSQALLEDYLDTLDEEGQDYLKRVRAASQRMGHLIDDLLQLSRITRGELQREQVDLSQLAAEVMAHLQEAEPTRQVEVIIASGLTTRADVRLMRVGLDNLLSNAWKFTANRSQARIEVGQTLTNGKTTFYVQDNGAGFDIAYADKLFGVFQRLHGVNEFEGTGIGLSIVQRIIHRHGGRIWAEAEEDQGATFYFILGE